MKKIVSYFSARLQEPSTWRGVTLLLTGLGASVSPELSEAIVIFGMMFAGAIGIATPDKKDGE